MVSVHETSGRYERPPRIRDEYRKVLEKSIKDDYMKEDLKYIIDEEWKQNLRAAWNDQSELKAGYKRFLATNKAIQAEVQQGGKAIVSVRRRALQKLFAQEEQQYQAELATLGKAFGKERL
ncbi:uncharacterized protein C1orf189 homolog isoform X1 [Pomacea canaliculata]|uniref:uncharacterized protein C1orf189 homolog isoform X1 n=1 Tax=Pomacea canaliculata TaxID=400727 RepID=UPI000D738F78|nr:uncharacterized protein C1orf189 homolog isoform X1 [Pomacea canaliculata]